MEYRIHNCTKKDFNGVWKINKESNLFATAQFMTSPMTIEKTMKSKKKLFLVAECLDTNETVGYILGKMRTKGVFFNELLGVTKEHRRRGVGGGLIIALLKLININKINKIENKFWGWKWFAEVPAYNYDALQMYKSLNFPVEGILKRHTKAKTDIYMVSFFLDEREIPKYGEHVSNPAKIIDDTIEQYLEIKLNGNIKKKNKINSNSTSNIKHWLKK